MRIRKPFAAGFIGLVVFAAFAGLAPSQYKIPDYKQSDKVLHFLTFLTLTLCFYWIVETSRRRVIHLTFFTCTLALGVGSEFVQGWLPNGRSFDWYDIVANILGSLSALGVCSWYHKRMLDRRRAAKSYHAVPGDDEERDLELGEGIGAQETGVTGAASGRTIEEELDNWDENEEDWETTEPGELNGDDSKSKSAEAGSKDVDGKKRND